MEQEVSSKVLKLQNIVTRRIVPMTDKGSDMLRLARSHILDEMEEKTGERYEAPFPVVFHLVLEHYCKSKGLL